MADVGGLRKVLAVLRGRASKARAEGVQSVLVGFSAAHALFVHENMESKTVGMNIPRRSGIGVYWGPAGGPKFLEAPAREMGDELAGIVRDGVAAGMPLGQALLLAGYRLQAESMERVPVEHGKLRESAFTRLEVEGRTA